MIAFVTGTVASRAADHCVLVVGGVGLKLLMSTQSLASLPSEGDEITVFTHLHVREDELTLFGFENEAEKSAFELLIGVSGVGPKVAMSVLSVLSASDLAAAMAREDVALVTSVPGVGKKTAQRIIIELGDKLGGASGPAAIPGSGAASDSAHAEATEALLAMGFSAAEAATAVKGAEGEEAADSKALVRYALQRLGGGRGR
jgi:Holliday junction DNA helicase RuvA